MLVEKFKDGFCVLLDPARILRPIGPIDVGLEGGDLEVVFHVHRHRIGKIAARQGGSSSSFL
jgi:hypothetical protein